MPRMPLIRRREGEFLQECSDSMLSDSAMRTYSSAINSFIKFGKKKGWPTNPKLIVPKHMREYHDHVREVYSSGTQDLYLKSVLKFLRSFCQNTNLDKVKFHVRVSRTNIQWYERATIGMLIRNADYPPLRGALVIFAYTGLRIGEVVHLKTTALSEEQLVVTWAKGERERKIPLDNAFWSAFEPYLDWRRDMERRNGKSTFLIVYQRGGNLHPYTTDGLREMLVRYGDRFGIHLTAHSMRRSFASDVYEESGHNLIGTQHLLGHASPATTEPYVQKGKQMVSTMATRPDYLNLEKKPSGRRKRAKRRKLYLRGSSQPSDKGLP